MMGMGVGLVVGTGAMRIDEDDEEGDEDAD